MKEPIIQIKNLVAAYNQRIVLDGINLDIYPGEALVILGKSGGNMAEVDRLLRQKVGTEKQRQYRLRKM